MMTFEQWRKTHDKITLESSPDHFRECCADNNWDAEEVLAVHQYAGGLHYVEELLAIDCCDLKRGTRVFHLMIERREWLVEAKEENKKELEQALFDWAKVECPTQVRCCGSSSARKQKMLKELSEGQTLTVVEVSLKEITVEDDDGDYITFDIDPVGLPRTYEGSESEI